MPGVFLTTDDTAGCTDRALNPFNLGPVLTSDLPSRPIDWSATPLRVLNVLAFVPLIIGNALAGAGALSGESIGVVANRWQTLLLPANWAFGIWSLIYLALAGFVVYQLLAGENSRKVARRIGPLWLVTIVFNVAWISAFSFSWFGLALVIMVLLLVSLILVFTRLNVGGTPVGAGERVFAQAPFSLYLGWVTVALIVNAAQYLSYLGWGGAPLSPLAWSVIMMMAAAGIGALFELRKGEWIIPLVVAWALAGIAGRYADQSTVFWVATALAGLSAVFPLACRIRRPTSPVL